MATGRKGNKAGSDVGLKAGKRGSKAKKAALRDLDAKRAKPVRGGFCATGKHLDTVIIHS